MWSRLVPFSHACLAAVLLASLAFAPWVHADPTAEEQYWLELINQARRDPAGELERLVNYATPTTFGSPSSDLPGIAAAMAFFGTDATTLAQQWATLTSAPALAWNDSLRSSAFAYSGLMVSTDQQSHYLDGTGSLEDRVAQRIGNAGYSSQYLDLGENIYSRVTSTLYGHAGFMIDWGDSDSDPNNGFGTGIQDQTQNSSHRQLLLDPHFKEIGIGTVTSGIPFTNIDADGPIVATQHLGNTWRFTGTKYVVDAILTGVVYSDTLQANNFYTPGEGLSGLTIEVFNNLTNALLFSGSTNTVGGFNISLPGVETGDVLRISALGLGLPDQFYTVASFTEIRGQPVTFYDNIYSSFQVVPEPTSLLLVSLGFVALRRRNRRTRTPIFRRIHR